MNKSLLHTAIASLYALQETIENTKDSQVVHTMVQRLNQLDGVTKEAPAKEAPAKEAPAKEVKKSLAELIAELPDGDGVPLKAPYNYFSNLSIDDARYYLAGCDATKIIDNDKLATCAKTGVNRELIDVVLASKDVKPTKSQSVRLGDKTKATIEKAKHAIDNGAELYEVMTANGVGKKAVQDFVNLVKAVRS